MAGKYEVAKGASFLSSGIFYKPGDEISPGVFGDEAVFKKLVAAGKIKSVGEPEPEKKPEPKAKPAAKKAPAKAPAKAPEKAKPAAKKAPAKGKKK